MKKWQGKIKTLLIAGLLLVMLVVYFAPYLHRGLPVTHDGENHVARFAQYYLALKQGQLIPRWAPALENGYGYPVFIYNYPLANILSLPLSVLKLDFETEFKIIVITMFILGGVACVNWQKYFFGKKKNDWLVLLAFWWMPYVWSAIWYRGNIGEVLIYFLIMVVLWQIERFRAGQKWSSITLAMSLTAYFLAHNVMVLFSAPLMAAYAWWRLYSATNKYDLFFSKSELFGKRMIWSAVPIALIGFGLSSWFWLPAFFEKDLVILGSSGLNQEYTQHFVTSKQLTQLSLTRGLSYPGVVDGLSFGVGLVTMGVWIWSVYQGWRRRTDRFYYPRLHGALVLLQMLLWWSQTSASLWLWQSLPLVNFIQFPWRLGLLAQLIGVIMLANCRWEKRSRLWWWSLILIQIYFCLLARPQDYFRHTREDYLTYPMSTTTSREDTPVTFIWDISNEASREPQIASGSGRLTQVTRLETTRKKYQVQCDDECLIVEHTARFPGFVTTIDGKRAEYVDDELIQGRIAFKVNSGEHQIETRWRENTGWRLWGDGLSLVSLVGLGWLAYLEMTSKKAKKKK